MFQLSALAVPPPPPCRMGWPPPPGEFWELWRVGGFSSRLLRFLSGFCLVFVKFLLVFCEVFDMFKVFVRFSYFT